MLKPRFYLPPPKALVGQKGKDPLGDFLCIQRSMSSAPSPPASGMEEVSEQTTGVPSSRPPEWGCRTPHTAWGTKTPCSFPSDFCFAVRHIAKVHHVVQVVQPQGSGLFGKAAAAAIANITWGLLCAARSTREVLIFK